MVEAELLIGHLRNQVRHLQSLLHYLEGRDAIESDDDPLQLLATSRVDGPPA